MGKYLIFGTGHATKVFLSDFGADFFRRNELVAFLDNNKEKWGTFFLGKKILSPKEIYNLTFDYIIICSEFWKDISCQLTMNYNIDNEMIILFNEINNYLYNYYNKFKLKKVIIIGDRIRFQEVRKRYEERFKIVNFLDIVEVCNLHCSFPSSDEYDCIFLMNLMDIFREKRYLGNIALEQLVIKKIVDFYHIDSDKIFTDRVSGLYRSKKVLINQKNDNLWSKSNLYYVISFTGTTGLGACVELAAKHVFYAKSRGYIPIIDMMTYPNQYLTDEDVGKKNAWETFFEQPCGYTMKEVQNNHYFSAGFSPPNMELTEDDTKHLVDFLEMKPLLKRKVENYMNSIFDKPKKILGVLFRGTDYANMKPYNHPIQPTLEEIIDIVHNKIIDWGDDFDGIYLCTEVEAAVEIFKKNFPNRQLYYYPQKRYSDVQTEWLARNNVEKNLWNRGSDYWTVLYTLSKCHSLIGGDCSGTAVAILLNQNEYRNVYIVHKGLYGIDDVDINKEASI